MRKLKIPLLLAIIFVMSLFLSACGNSETSNKQESHSDNQGTDQHKLAKNQVLNFYDEGDISTMNTLHATDGISLRALEEVQSGLTRIDKDGKIIPDMASEEPKISNDKKVYTFKIRKDANWSNGDPVTAQDFVYAWRKEVSKDTAGEYAYIFPAAGIKNAAKILDPKDPMYNKVDKLGVRAVDKKTLQVTLERPTPYFLSLMSFPSFYPLDKKIVQKFGNKYATEPNKMVFNGPFIMTKWDHGEGWTFKKNPDYWDKKDIHLDKVSYKVIKDMSTRVNLYKTGKLDFTRLTTDYITQFKNSKELHTGALIPSMAFLRLNEKVPALKNDNIRDAIYNAIDRKSLVNDLLKDGSYPAYYFVGKDFVKFSNGDDFRSAYPTINKHSLKWAKSKWEKGLKEINRKSVTLNLLYSSSSSDQEIVTYIKNQLEKNLPGLNIKISTQPVKQFDKLEGTQQYDISLANWGPDYYDPMSDLDMWVTDGEFNRTGFSNSQYDKLIEKAKELGAKPDERLKVMQNAEKILLEKAPIVPLYQNSIAYLEKPYVKQIAINRPGPKLDWTYAYILEH
ncbi:peptide ABC transporter substrate-binding protein [Scopulibacillus cellulosilyticus]|uniref:Peptide ABC transporter substrate-binding protein n=2 Tax=Scopulibacillus cellulosilyticus TaxID=2665665 RepID=A0ABW2PUJ7_9BACL